MSQDFREEKHCQDLVLNNDLVQDMCFFSLPYPLDPYIVLYIYLHLVDLPACIVWDVTDDGFECLTMKNLQIVRRRNAGFTQSGKAKDRFRWAVSWFQCVSTPNELSKRNATPKYKKISPRPWCFVPCVTPPNTNIAPENGPSQKQTIVFQPSIFRCYVGSREAIFSGFFSRQCWVTHQDITVYCRVSTRAVGEISTMPELTSVQFGYVCSGQTITTLSAGWSPPSSGLVKKCLQFRFRNFW